MEALGADGDINGYQLFNYCMNDPVNRRDEAGSWSLPNWAKVAIGAALIVGAAVVATVATGGVACFAYGAAIGAAKGAVSGAIGGAISGAIESRIATGSWDGALEAAIDGAADGFLGGAIGGFIVGGLTSPNCFVAGTPIQTENGAVPIEEIVPGQLVWAENPDTGECTLKRVVQLFRNEKYELVHVQVRGATITTTAGHPFFVQGQGWIFAKDLKVGYQLKLLSGGTALVEAVEWKNFPSLLRFITSRLRSSILTLLESMAFWYIIYVCKKLSQVTIMDTPRECLWAVKLTAMLHMLIYSTRQKKLPVLMIWEIYWWGN